MNTKNTKHDEKETDKEIITRQSEEYADLEKDFIYLKQAQETIKKANYSRLQILSRMKSLQDNIKKRLERAKQEGIRQERERIIEIIKVLAGENGWFMKWRTELISKIKEKA